MKASHLWLTISALAIIGTLATAPAAAATFLVNVGNDAVDADVFDGTCDSDLGTLGSQCTLRAAIQQANFSVAADVIGFADALPSRTVMLTIAGVNEHSNLTGDLDISKDLQICGGLEADPCNLEGNVVVDGGQVDGVFHVSGSATVLFRWLEITNGKITPGYSEGGAIRNENGTVTVDRCNLHHNLSWVYGGGIQNEAALTIVDSTIDSNAALDGGGLSNTGNATILRSLLAHNSGAGGAIYNTNSVSVISSTLSTNHGGPSYSGGIYHAGGTLTISSSTIVNNDGGGVSGFAIYGGTVRVRNSVIAGNALGDCTGNLTSFGGNFIGSPYSTTCTITQSPGSPGGDLVGTYQVPIDPMLGPLQDNGGLTLTHAPLSGSPLVEGGEPSQCLLAQVVPSLITADQRGFIGSMGRMQGARCDVGAVEARYFNVNIPGDGVDTNLGDGLCDTDNGTAGSQCSVRAAIQQTNATPGPDVIQLPALTLTLTIMGALDGAGDLDVRDAVLIQGAGASQTLLSAVGLGDRVLHIQDNAQVELRDLTINAGSAVGGDGAGVRIEDGSTVKIVSSEITGNTASGVGDGGGIWCAGNLELDRVTIAQNSARRGGGVFMALPGGFLNAIGSTFSANTAALEGSAVMQNGLSASLTNTTITTNIISVGAGLGGAVGVLSGSFIIENTVVAGNVDQRAAPAAPDCYAPTPALWQSKGHNLFGVGCGVSAATGDRAGTTGSPFSAGLSPITGTQPRIHTPLAGSLVIDSGADDNCPAFDQRGYARPAGIACDIGAVEVNGTDLRLTMTNDRTSVSPGTLINYTITVDNDGPSGVKTAQLTDMFPAAYTQISWTCTATGGATCPGPYGYGDIGLGLKLPPGGHLSFFVYGEIAASATGTLTNVATITATDATTDSDPSNNSATDADPIVPLADLNVSVAATPQPANAGSSFTVTATVNNAGPSTANAVTLTQGIPAGTTFVSAAPGEAGCTPSGATLVCSLGSIATGVEKSVSFVFSVQGSGASPADSVVASTTADSNMTNNTASRIYTLTPVANLALSGATTAGTFGISESATVTWTITNQGPSTGNEVVFSQTVPAGVSLGGVATAGACTLLADRLDCTLGALAALATVTVSADVTAPAPMDAALVGSVRAKELDANTSDNTTTVALKIVTEAQGVGSVATPDGTDSSTTPVNLKTSSTKPAGCHAQGGDPALLWLAAFVLLVLRRKRR